MEDKKQIISLALNLKIIRFTLKSKIKKNI